MRKIIIGLSLFYSSFYGVFAQSERFLQSDSVYTGLSDEEVEKVRNMPNIEVGKGITFQPQNKSYKMTMRFRMQDMVGLYMDEDFKVNKTEAQVKRLRLRFDGYIYSPKLTYSLQLGFSAYDTKVLPNGNNNIIRDAMVYYIPSSTWNIGFGQTKIKANRARVNSSSALQFVDRSIVNSEFNLDRDFGLFGEYNKQLFGDFNISAKGSVTLGEGRNWNTSQNSGLAYTGRLELFPLGRFKSYGEIIEGDFEREQTLKVLFAGTYSYNNRALRVQGQNGAKMPDGMTRSLSSYFFDCIVKYRGFAFYTDVMGRKCNLPILDYETSQFVYSGKGINVQTSYILPSNWEFALRNSTLMPDKEIRSMAGYKSFNQSTFGVTKYLIGHSLKIQADASYNYRENSINEYNRWELRFSVELGL